MCSNWSPSSFAIHSTRMPRDRAAPYIFSMTRLPG
jgi:hypothetical protein